MNESVSVYIRELMGTFDLDTNPVLEFLLDTLEIHLHKQMTEDAAAQTKTHAPYYYTVILLLNDVLKEFKKESGPHLLDSNFPPIMTNPRLWERLHIRSIYVLSFSFVTDCCPYRI